MRKESLLSSMPKLILAVVLIVCVGAVIGLMGYALIKKPTRVEAPEVKTPDEIVEIDTSDWQTYRNEEFGFSVTFDGECKNIWESKTTNYTDGNILARTDFYFKDYPLHIFSTVIVYEKEWFIENGEKRVQYKEWSAKNNGTIEEYNKIRDEMKSEFVREKGEIVWLKGDSDGYPLGTYLEENNDYVFVLGIGPNGCMATELLCSLPIRKMTMDSFQIIDTDSDWQTYRNEEFGFEIKYPRNWKAIENGENGGVLFFDNPFYANEYKLSEGPEFEDKYRDYAFISIGRYSEGTRTAAGTITKDTEIKDFVYKLYRKDRFVSEETIIGGQKAYMFGYMPIVYLKQKNDIVTISMWSGPEHTDHKKLAATFRQILSTFKFIEKEAD